MVSTHIGNANMLVSIFGAPFTLTGGLTVDDELTMDEQRTQCVEYIRSNMFNNTFGSDWYTTRYCYVPVDAIRQLVTRDTITKIVQNDALLTKDLLVNDVMGRFNSPDFITNIVEKQTMLFTITLEAELHMDFLYNLVRNGITDQDIVAIDERTDVGPRFANALSLFLSAKSRVWAPSLTYSDYKQVIPKEASPPFTSIREIDQARSLPTFAVTFHPLHVPMTGGEGREYLLSIANGPQSAQACVVFTEIGCFGFWYDGRFYHVSKLPAT